MDIIRAMFKKTVVVAVVAVIMLVKLSADSYAQGAGSDNLNYTFSCIDGTTVSTTNTTYKANTAVTLSNIAQSDWISSDDVNVIFVECDGVDKSTVEQFASGLSSYMKVCYTSEQSPGSNAMWVYYNAFNGGGSGVTYPVIVYVDQNNKIQNLTTSVYSASKILKNIKAFTDIEYEETPTLTLSVPVTYGQTEARSMLSMINEWRTGDTWYWNSDDSSKTYIASGERDALQYDYSLEKVAMQRAAEVAVYYSHKRPNGNDCWSAYDDVLGEELSYSSGENIAIGYSSAESVFNGWKEEAYNYEQQGHRRNMLSSSYRYIGIGHCKIDGVHVWVQELSYGAYQEGETAANDSDSVACVEVLPDSIKSQSIVFSRYLCILLEPGEIRDMSSLTDVRISLEGTWSAIANRGGFVVKGYPISWESGNSEVFSVSPEGVITANKVGEALVTASANFEGSVLSNQLTVMVKENKNVGIKKLKRGNKKVTLYLKNLSKNISGVQVQYSTSSTFKNAKTKTVKAAKADSITIRKLKGKKTYYLRVRSYKKLNGKRKYSSWSAVKKVSM